MTRMENAVARLLALPEDEQEVLAADIEALLAEPASMLTSAQWEAVDRELAATDANLTHAEVMGRMRARFGR